MLFSSFNDLNNRIQILSNKIVQNENDELPLLRRNAAEIFGIITPLVAAKIMDIHNVLPLDKSLHIAAPIAVLSLISYLHTVHKRKPYQSRGFDLGETLHVECKRLKKEFPRARWSERNRSFILADSKKLYNFTSNVETLSHS